MLKNRSYCVRTSYPDTGARSCEMSLVMGLNQRNDICWRQERTKELNLFTLGADLLILAVRIQVTFLMINGNHITLYSEIDE